MVDFNSAATSTPKGAVTYDMEGDLDFTRIESETKIFNICKECGSQSLYQSKQQWIQYQNQAYERAKYERRVKRSLIFSIPACILLSSSLLSVHYMMDFGFGVLGGVISAFIGLFDFIFKKLRNIILFVLLIAAGFAWKRHQEAVKDEALAELSIGKIFEALDLNSAKYLKKGYGISWKFIPGSFLKKDLKSRADRGIKEAEVTFGFIEESRGNFAEAEKYYTKAAAQGSPRAMFRLGILNLEGLKPILQSDSLAIFWFRKAAEIGSTEAETMLSELEKSGEKN